MDKEERGKMYISVRSILNCPQFINAEILAGKDGLHRSVERISVADLVLSNDKTTEEIVKKGDFFLTCLAQFNSDDRKRIEEYFDVLIQFQCSGLMIMSNQNNRNLITDEVISKCNENRFPVIFVEDEISYAEIIKIAYDYVADDINSRIRQAHILRLMYENLSELETVELVRSLNRNMGEHLQVACFAGNVQSDISYAGFLVDTLNAPGQVCVKCDRVYYHIYTVNKERNNKDKILSKIRKLKECFDIKCIGVSGVWEQYNIKNALKESYDAFEMAKYEDDNMQIYHPLSTNYLVQMLRNSHEAKIFFDSYEEALIRSSTGEGVEDLRNTVKAYVKCKGIFKNTAEEIHQHENTVRYRINKLREQMGMEDNIVEFHEIVSIAVKMEQIYKSSG